MIPGGEAPGGVTAQGRASVDDVIPGDGVTPGGEAMPGEVTPGGTLILGSVTTHDAVEARPACRCGTGDGEEIVPMSWETGNCW